MQLAALLLFAVGVVAQQLQINTPTGATGAIQCLTFQITWVGGTAPFIVRLLDPAQNLVEVISDSAQSSPLAWTVNQPAGQGFILSINDATGAVSSTAVFQIQEGGNSACLSASGSSASAASTSAASSASVSSGSVVSVSTTSAAVASSSAASVSSASSASVSRPASSSSATRPASASVASSTPSASTTPSSAGAVSAGVFAPLIAALVALAA